jgi:hypothetical protein
MGKSHPFIPQRVMQNIHTNLRSLNYSRKLLLAISIKSFQKTWNATSTLASQKHSASLLCNELPTSGYAEQLASLKNSSRDVHFSHISSMAINLLTHP